MINHNGSENWKTREGGGAQIRWRRNVWIKPVKCTGLVYPWNKTCTEIWEATFAVDGDSWPPSSRHLHSIAQQNMCENQTNRVLQNFTRQRVASWTPCVTRKRDDRYSLFATLSLIWVRPITLVYLHFSIIFTSSRNTSIQTLSLIYFDNKFE
jgi:hypothetical protein